MRVMFISLWLGRRTFDETLNKAASRARVVSATLHVRLGRWFTSFPQDVVDAAATSVVKAHQGPANEKLVPIAYR